MRRSGLALESVELTETELREAACVLIVTDHDQYDYQRVVDHASLVVDTRNATGALIRGREKVWAA